MSRLDWVVLSAALLFVVLWGLYKGRGATTGDHYIGGGRDHRWWLIGLSIIATQTSARQLRAMVKRKEVSAEKLDAISAARAKNPGRFPDAPNRIGDDRQDEVQQYGIK